MNNILAIQHEHGNLKWGSNPGDTSIFRIATDTPVICPHCQEAGEKSTVEPGESTSTCAFVVDSFYDEQGRLCLRPDNTNTHTIQYRCSRGHDFGTKTQGGKTVIVTEPTEL